MKSRSLILLTSLGLNVALVAGLIVRHRVAASTETIPASSGAPVSPAPKTKPRPAAKVSSPDETPAPGSSTFHWAQLESDDYPEYIARLRAFGVPEKTIRDLIIAEVQKLYRPKFAALRPPKTETKTKFWENRRFGFNPYGSLTKEQQAQMAALQKEQTELIKTLLGKNVYQEISKNSGYPDATERTFGPMSAEQREKVTEMQQRFQEAQSAIYAKAGGYFDMDMQYEVKAAQRKLRDELSTVLTPEQLEEYQLRSSDTANSMRYQLGVLEPNEKEFRAIVKYKLALEDISSVLNPSYNPDDQPKPISPDEQKILQGKQKELEAALAQNLDADRLKLYKLSERGEFQNLLQSGVAAESVLKIVDLKQEVEAAAYKVRLDKSLTPDQRTAALQAIRTETEKSLADTLGARRAKAYASNGGWWLRNLAPR